MQLKNLDFLLTFNCQAKCRHCSYKAGSDRKGYIKAEIANKYLGELINHHPLESITIHGGEPFIYYEIMKKIIIKAKELGIPRIGVITNSYWANSKNTGKRILIELKNAGLTQITFSVDSFHQEYISHENVKNAIEAAASVSFDHIWVDSYFLGNFDTNNQFNNTTKSILKDMEGVNNVEYNKYLLGFEGRGADLAEYVNKSTEIPIGQCPLPFWIGGDLKNPTTVEIDPEGNVTLCPGICIGNTNDLSLVQLLQNYDYTTHPIISRIIEKGPIGLMDIAIKKGYKKEKRFINECHLCYELRKFLRPYYLEYIAPEGIY